MPTQLLPPAPHLDHLKKQAKDLLMAHQAGDPGAYARILEFHPRFVHETDAHIRAATLSLSDAQLVIAREYGFPSWPKLKHFVETAETETRSLEKQLQERQQFMNLIGKSTPMQCLYQLIEDISESDATVLILGETSTGKESVAEALHFHSLRADGPLIKVNCSAFPETLLESELFGHIKDAFTGALSDRPGRFELADGGTLFLDEIGDVSPAVQLRLLQVLERREFERLGDIRPRKVNVRLIAATNQDLREAVANRTFLEELFYRLSVVPITLPPLRERRDDIPLLVEHFIGKLRDRTGRRIEHISGGALNLLMVYDWPGNIRELENAIEFAFVACKTLVIEVSDLPPVIQSQGFVQKNSDGNIA